MGLQMITGTEWEPKGSSRSAIGPEIGKNCEAVNGGPSLFVMSEFREISARCQFLRKNRQRVDGAKLRLPQANLVRQGMHGHEAGEQGREEEKVTGSNPFHDKSVLSALNQECNTAYQSAKPTNSTTKKKICFRLTGSISPYLRCGPGFAIVRWIRTTSATWYSRRRMQLWIESPVRGKGCGGIVRGKEGDSPLFRSLCGYGLYGSRINGLP